MWRISVFIIARTRRLDDENVKFRKSNMADGRHFENHYISISQPRLVRISRNLVCGHKFYFRPGNVTKKNLKLPNSRWRTDAILKIIFFPYNLAPSCPIKTKFAYCPFKMKFGVYAYEGQVIKMPNYENPIWLSSPFSK